MSFNIKIPYVTSKAAEKLAAEGRIIQESPNDSDKEDSMPHTVFERAAHWIKRNSMFDKSIRSLLSRAVVLWFIVNYTLSLAQFWSVTIMWLLTMFIGGIVVRSLWGERK